VQGASHPSVRRAHPAEIRAALAWAAAVGPFFTLESELGDREWRRPADFYARCLPGVIAAAAAQLGGAQPRVAASMVQLGYAARLWSPVLACALRHAIVPDLGGLRVSADDAQIRPALAEPRGWRVTDPAELAALSCRLVVEEQLEPLSRALPVKIASGLLRGNAASAMIGSVGVLVGRHPELGGPGRDLAGELLAGRLHGTGRLTGAGLDFVRRSCCLYYRVPGGGLCADCPLDDCGRNDKSSSRH
jgi:FhuF 2Fe-2S C-terminal domain